MEISIITVAYNSEKTLRDTIESVLNQTYSDIEYIIIDGLSQDNTVGIIREYEPKFCGRLKWMSERDLGIYDAINKGVRMATGDYVTILNSDDFFIAPNVISVMVDAIKIQKVDAIYANTLRVSKDNIEVINRKTRKPITTRKKVIYGSKESRHDYVYEMTYRGWHPNHPSFTISKKVYEMYGLFNTDYKIAADFDLMFRFLVKHKISLGYLDEYVIKMRDGGASAASLSILWQNIRDCTRIISSYGYKVNLYSYALFRIIHKIHMYTLRGVLKSFCFK